MSKPPVFLSRALLATAVVRFAIEGYGNEFFLLFEVFTRIRKKPNCSPIKPNSMVHMVHTHAQLCNLLDTFLLNYDLFRSSWH